MCMLIECFGKLYMLKVWSCSLYSRVGRFSWELQRMYPLKNCYGFVPLEVDRNCPVVHEDSPVLQWSHTLLSNCMVWHSPCIWERKKNEQNEIIISFVLCLRMEAEVKGFTGERMESLGRLRNLYYVSLGLLSISSWDKAGFWSVTIFMLSNYYYCKCMVTSVNVSSFNQCNQYFQSALHSTLPRTSRCH